MIKISIQQEDFDVSAEIKSISSKTVGAIATFSGIVRDSSESNALISLTLEHYPGMSEAALEKIADAAMQKGSLEAVRIIHRVGRLLPEDNIVFVGCAVSASSPPGAAAFTLGDPAHWCTSGVTPSRYLGTLGSRRHLFTSLSKICYAVMQIGDVNYNSGIITWNHDTFTNITVPFNGDPLV